MPSRQTTDLQDTTGIKPSLRARLRMVAQGCINPTFATSHLPEKNWYLALHHGTCSEAPHSSLLEHGGRVHH